LWPNWAWAAGVARRTNCAWKTILSGFAIQSWCAYKNTRIREIMLWAEFLNVKSYTRVSWRSRLSVFAWVTWTAWKTVFSWSAVVAGWAYRTLC
jgi:hypothetical protein